jgi:large subunit ribosomal protein L23
MIQADQILIIPIVTEKATEATSLANQYSFKVHPSANKISVRQAIESAFKGVEVKGVNILNVKPKAKRNRYSRTNPGRKPGYKKAIVTLAEGHTIDLLS